MSPSVVATQVSQPGGTYGATSAYSLRYLPNIPVATPCACSRVARVSVSANALTPPIGRLLVSTPVSRGYHPPDNRLDRMGQHIGTVTYARSKLMAWGTRSVLTVGIAQSVPAG